MVFFHSFWRFLVLVGVFLSFSVAFRDSPKFSVTKVLSSQQLNSFTRPCIQCLQGIRRVVAALQVLNPRLWQSLATSRLPKIPEEHQGTDTREHEISVGFVSKGGDLFVASKAFLYPTLYIQLKLFLTAFLSWTKS